MSFVASLTHTFFMTRPSFRANLLILINSTKNDPERDDKESNSEKFQKYFQVSLHLSFVMAIGIIPALRAIYSQYDTILILMWSMKASDNVDSFNEMQWWKIFISVAATFYFLTSIHHTSIHSLLVMIFLNSKTVWSISRKM